MSELIEFLELVLFPQSISDIVVISIIAIILAVPFCMKFSLIQRKWLSIVQLVIALCGLAIFYGLILTSVVPHFQRFPDAKVGILFPRFSGARLSEHFGHKRLNEILENKLTQMLQEFQAKMKMSGLDTLIAVRSVSWSAGSQEQADRLRKKYNASCILWGTVTRLQSDARLSTFFNVDTVGFGLHIPSVGPITAKFDLVVGGSYTMRFSDITFDHVAFFVKQLIDGIMPTLAVTVNEKDPLLSAELIRRLPSIDKWYKQADHAGFLLQSAASAYERIDSLDKALEYYALSWKHLNRFKRKLDSTAHTTPPDIDIRRFAAFSKWKEAFLAYKIGDTLRSKECFGLALVAAEGDSVIQNLIFNDGRIFGMIESDTLIIELRARGSDSTGSTEK